MHEQLMPHGLSARRFPDAPMTERDPAAMLQCAPLSSENSKEFHPTLAALLQQWEQQIKRRMESALQEDSDHGRRLIEHGAVCIFNCAMELREVLQGQIEQALCELRPATVQRQID